MARLLRTDLPDEVWDRLNTEAEAHDLKIGKYVRDLIIRRDQRRHPGASPSTDPTAPPQKGK
jgi:hypothetical protein